MTVDHAVSGSPSTWRIALVAMCHLMSFEIVRVLLMEKHRRENRENKIKTTKPTSATMKALLSTLSMYMIQRLCTGKVERIGAKTPRLYRMDRIWSWNHMYRVGVRVNYSPIYNGSNITQNTSWAACETHTWLIQYFATCPFLLGTVRANRFSRKIVHIFKVWMRTNQLCRAGLLTSCASWRFQVWNKPHSRRIMWIVAHYRNMLTHMRTHLQDFGRAEATHACG